MEEWKYVKYSVQKAEKKTNKNGPDPSKRKGLICKHKIIKRNKK